MKRLTTSAVALASLMGSLLIADIADAKKPRSSVERRQRPNGGFFESSASSRSYTNKRSVFRSWRFYSPPNRYSRSTPAARWAPSRSDRVVYRRYVVPSNTVIPSTLVPSTQPAVAGATPTSVPPVGTSQSRTSHGRVFRVQPSTTSQVVKPTSEVPAVISAPAVK